MEELHTASMDDPTEQLLLSTKEKIRAKVPRDIILRWLEKQGMTSGEAALVLREARHRLMADEEVTRQCLLPAIGGGLGAAFAGGIAWSLIAIHLGYELGYMAMAIGALAGYCVVKATRGKKGLPLQLIAIGSGVFGIFVGKYFYVIRMVKEYLVEEYGAEAASMLPIFSLASVRVFFKALSDTVTPFDALWVALAIAAAWRIPKSTY